MSTKFILSFILIFSLLLSPLSVLAESKVNVSQLTNSQLVNDLPSASKIKLEQNGFIIVEGRKKYDDFTAMYKDCKEKNLPIFVTTDSVFHTSHIFFDYMLRILEIEHFRKDAIDLTKNMIAASLRDYQSAKGQKVKEAARKNVAFFAVAYKLLDPSFAVPALVAKEVEKEIVLISDASKYTVSPIFDYDEDYTQYRPRGHYTRNDEFKTYFRAMMWYGRLMFRVSPKKMKNMMEIPDTDGMKMQTRQALLIVKAFWGSRHATRMWEKIYRPTVFFVGKSDDLYYAEYSKLASKIYGNKLDLADETKLNTFIKEAQKLRKPRILSTGAFSDNWQSTAMGFRFMGQRFIPDSYIFQNLVYGKGKDKVSTFKGKGKPFTLVINSLGAPIRGFPRGLDAMAVFGSKMAEEIIFKEGDADYINYPKQFALLKKEFSFTSEEKWNQNLYYSVLYSIKALFEPPPANAPYFMKGKAWQGKQLNTALGTWAELRHDTILYAKQSYTPLMKGMFRPPAPEHGYVEPSPLAYKRIRNVISKLKAELKKLQALDPAIENNMTGFENLLKSLETISNKELKGEKLTDKEYELINNFGGYLKSITTFPAEVTKKITSSTDEKMALVADVHTNLDERGVGARVLEEAVGNPHLIYVITPVDGKWKVTVGGVFSYYEFKHPMKDRLTDEKWQQMLKTEKNPAVPKWTKMFR